MSRSCVQVGVVQRDAGARTQLHRRGHVLLVEGAPTGSHEAQDAEHPAAGRQRHHDAGADLQALDQLEVGLVHGRLADQLRRDRRPQLGLSGQQDLADALVVTQLWRVVLLHPAGELHHRRVAVRQRQPAHPVRPAGDLHGAPVGQPLVDDDVGQLLQSYGDVERGAEDAADPPQQRQPGVRASGGVLRDGRRRLGGQGRLVRRVLLGDVRADTHHGDDLTVRTDNGSPGAAHPVHAAVGVDNPVLDVVIAAGRHRVLDRGDGRFDVVRVQQRHVAVEGAVELTRLEAEHAGELVVPVDPVRGHVPVPRAHPAGLQGELVALDADGREARRGLLVSAGLSTLTPGLRPRPAAGFPSRIDVRPECD